MNERWFDLWVNGLVMLAFADCLLWLETLALR